MLVPILSRAGHDRDAAHRNDERWLAEVWPSARVLLLADDATTPAATTPAATTPAATAAATTPAATPAATTPAAKDDEPAAHLSLRSAAEVDPSAPRTFLGQADGIAYFSVPADATASDPGRGDDAEAWLGLRDLGGQLDDLGAGLLTSAVALTNWHATHRHCPRCGALTEVILAGWARRCPVDDSQHFPRTDPAVIMLVHDGGDRCVLGRQASWPQARYSILAGFVEAGESAEAAVVREVYEEVGLRITDVTYTASQPWPFPASLMLGFTARAVGDLTIERHDEELADAGWFSRAEIRAAATWDTEPAGIDDPVTRLGALPGGISIARQILNAWLETG